MSQSGIILAVSFNFLYNFNRKPKRFLFLYSIYLLRIKQKISFSFFDF